MSSIIGYFVCDSFSSILFICYWYSVFILRMVSLLIISYFIIKSTVSI